MYREVKSQLEGNLSIPFKVFYIYLVLFFFLPNYWYVKKTPTGFWSVYLVVSILWCLYFSDVYVLSFYIFHINLVVSSLIFGLLYHFNSFFRKKVSLLFPDNLILFFCGNPFSKPGQKITEAFCWTSLGSLGIFFNDHITGRSRQCRPGVGENLAEATNIPRFSIFWYRDGETRKSWTIVRPTLVRLRLGTGENFLWLTLFFFPSGAFGENFFSDSKDFFNFYGRSLN